MGLEKQPRIRDRKFLAFAKALGGPCCIHRRLTGETVTNGIQLHHWGEHGIGTKGSDYQVARVCAKCHAIVQGKRRLAFARSGDWETLAALQEDSIALLECYLVAISRGEV
jgi:hypothetical protein